MHNVVTRRSIDFEIVSHVGATDVIKAIDRGNVRLRRADGVVRIIGNFL